MPRKQLFRVYIASAAAGDYLDYCLGLFGLSISVALVASPSVAGSVVGFSPVDSAEVDAPGSEVLTALFPTAEESLVVELDETVVGMLEVTD